MLGVEASITPARWISANWGWSLNLTARPRVHPSSNDLRRPKYLEPARAVVASHNDKINGDVWPKTFRFQQVSTPSLYTDRRFSSNQFLSNVKKTAKDAEWRRSLFLCSLLPVLIYMRIFTLRDFTWLPAWKYVTICNISSLRTAMFFQSKKYIFHTEHMRWRLRWHEWRFSPQFLLQEC